LKPEEDALFRLLVTSVADYAIFMLDPQGYVRTWNVGAERLKYYAPTEIIGRHFSVFYPPADREHGKPEAALARAIHEGSVEDEGWRVRRDGTLFWANVVLTAMRTETGELVGFSKVTRDLTERREHEERLRVSEERFRLLVEGVTDYAIFALDAEGHVLSWNAGAERIKQYSASEIIGRHFSIFYTPEALERDWPSQELIQARALGRFEDEGWRLRKDGSRFWANVVITAIRDERRRVTGFSKITRDLTERREYEERLRLSEERFRLLVEGVQDYAIYLLDPTGRVTSWNAGAQRITGYSANEIIGRSFEVFYPPEDLAAGRPAQELRTALLQRRAEDRGWRLRKDGTRFWADVVVTALRDARGELVGFAKVSRDMSERKRMEELEEQGRNVTEFLAMLAHELRNPLAPIGNALGILALGKESSPEIGWAREVIDRQLGHLSRLVDDLLDVSRITRGKLQMHSETLDLNAAVARAIEASRPLLEARRHSLEVEVSPTPIGVHGDLVRLAQVFSNLLNNAAKYTPEGGRVSIRAGTEGDDAVVRVRDTGLGIPPEFVERVFDLFAQGERTLERAEGGLGIGLTLARRIVLLHGGSIQAQSAGTGKGSEFTVRLPTLHLEREPPAAPRTVVDPPAAVKRSIVVVDDNADSATSMAMLLRMQGHAVETALDGPEALELISRTRPEIVFLDIGLPGMNGFEVATALRARPEGTGVRLYAMTGYGQAADRERSMGAGFDGHLVKPVLLETLRQVIESGGQGG
jgi:PAS domain S-box-containing protein